MLLKRNIIIGVTLGCLLMTVQVWARQNVLTGSVGLGYDYNSNVFRVDGGRTNEWNSTVSPEISLASRGEADEISLAYAPQFSYNHRRDTDDMAHNLTLGAERVLSSRWQITMNDAYLYSDNPVFEADATLPIEQQFQRADAFTQAEVVRLLFPEITWVPGQLSFVLSQLTQRYNQVSTAVQQTVNSLLSPAGGNEGRQRYFSNNLSFGSVYKFAQDSQLSIGYAINVLDNKTGVQADRVEHNPTIALEYRFNPRWRLEVAYDFSKIDFDSTDDSTTNNPRIKVDYSLSNNNKITTSYNYENISYDGTTGDSTNQTLVLGWNRALNQVSNFTADVDFSYDSRELAWDERELALNLGWDRKYDRGNVSFTGKGAWAEKNDTISWGDLRRSWRIGGDVSYDLWDDLSSKARGSYERRYVWDALQKTRFDDLDLGVGLTYKFARWYSLSLDYDYKLFETDSPSLDDYNEHLIKLELSVVKELWRW